MRTHQLMSRTTIWTLAALLAGALLGACGNGTRASGSFGLVPMSPEGFDEAAGTTTLTRSGSGTDVAIELHGLMPNRAYTSHLHAGSCDQPDPGGPHFAFDLNGPDMPPNEIHLLFTSDSDGNGTAEVHNDQVVPEGDGRSIVVHMTGAGAGHGSHATGSADGPSHTHQPKIVCAELD